MRAVLPRLVIAAAVPILLLGGCASADKGTSTASAPPALKNVKVTGAAGQKPTVTVASSPTSVTKTGTLVVAPGKGETITAGERVTVDYVLLNGKDGKEVDTSYGKQPAHFLADPKQLLPGLANSLIGQKVGSRVLVGIAPKDGFGDQGNPQLGIGKDDSLLFVLDLHSAATPLKKATGDTVTPAAGLPTVKDNGDKAPTITMPTGVKPPTKTVAQVLIRGKGAKVESGQTVTMNYVGAIYGTGKVFDSSYSKNQPLQSQIGVGGLVPGFDKSILGQTVGSRVLLVIPPAEGYTSKGNAQAGIKGTDTIVFVVDILDAA